EETDVNGCKAKDYMHVSAYPQPVVGISAQSVPSCNGNGTLSGPVTLQTFNGAGYSFSWSPTGSVTSTTSASSIGAYTVTVTDVHQCTNSASYSLMCPVSDTCTLTICSCTVGTASFSQNIPYCNIDTFKATGSTC